MSKTVVYESSMSTSCTQPNYKSRCARTWQEGISIDEILNELFMFFFFLLQFTCGSSVNDFNILAKSDAGAAKSDTTCRKKKERKLRKIDTIYKKRNTFNKFQDLQLEQSSKQPHKPVVHWPCAPETGVPVVAGYCWACCWNIFGDFPLASWAIFKLSENKRKEN